MSHAPARLQRWRFVVARAGDVGGSTAAGSAAPGSRAGGSTAGASAGETAAAGCTAAGSTAGGSTAAGSSQREALDSWIAALSAAGLPVAWTEGARARPRVTFGAPIPSGLALEADLLDVVLRDRWPIWRVREAMVDHVPPGWRIVDLHDVWPGAPPLPAQVAGADYRIVLATDASDAALGDAAREMLAAPRLMRARSKGAGTVEYDLRPLVAEVRVCDDGPPVVLSLRTRIHPELGSGRPEEVVAELAARAGTAIGIESIVRERLVLVDEPDDLGVAERW